jgi:2-oxoglutarate ferredoxin oxidoreductase subunit alpha
MQRLLHKWETAKTMLPEPHIRIRDREAKIGALFFGTTTHSAYEAVDRLGTKGLPINTLRLRAFPFGRAALDFIDNHDLVFVIEQNRDGQLRKLLLTECEIRPDKLVSVVNFDGMPITAEFITAKMEAVLSALSQEQKRKIAAGGAI